MLSRRPSPRLALAVAFSASSLALPLVGSMALSGERRPGQTSSQALSRTMCALKPVSRPVSRARARSPAATTSTAKGAPSPAIVAVRGTWPRSMASAPVPASPTPCPAPPPPSAAPGFATTGRAWPPHPHHRAVQAVRRSVPMTSVAPAARTALATNAARTGAVDHLAVAVPVAAVGTRAAAVSAVLPDPARIPGPALFHG